MSNNRDISQAVLDDLEIKITRAYDAVKAAKGQKTDRLGEFCRQFGISKQALAIGIIFDAKGEITQAELAEKLNIDERTLRKRSWKRVRSFLQDYRQFPCR